MSHELLNLIENLNQSEEPDRGSEHTFICNGGVRWHIDAIFNSIYFNCSRLLKDDQIFQECTIICPLHKQSELACADVGASNGGPPYCLEHHKTKRLLL